MPEEEYDGYAGTAGLIDDVDITVTDAEFTFDSNYNDGKTLVMKLTVLNEEDGEEEEVLLSTGSGWEDKKGSKGKLAVKEDTGEPNKKGFSRSSRYHKFTMAAVDVGAPLQERDQPWHAEIWEGLRFHVERKTEANPISGKEQDNLYPTAYLGEAGEKKAKSSRATKKAASSKAKEEPEEETSSSDNGDVPVAMRAKLKALAKECDDHDEFIERAMGEVKGVTDNEAAEALVVDPDFFAEVNA